MPITLIPETKADRFDFRRHPLGFMKRFLYIKDKIGRLIPFFPNHIQRSFHGIVQGIIASGCKPWTLTLKFRQGGITTYEQAMNFGTIVAESYKTVATIGHNAEATTQILGIANIFYEKMDVEYRPARLTDRNKRDINLIGNNSKFYLGTAGNKSFARSDTFQRIHATEVSRWPGKIEDNEDLVAGITQACRYGVINFETTANGARGLFFKMWNSAKNGDSPWTPVFIPWYSDPTLSIPLEKDEVIELTDEESKVVKIYNLTMEQIKCRRGLKEELKRKTGDEYNDSLFYQEYPEDDITCFIASGIHWFNIDVIRDLIPLCKSPIETRDNGHVKIWVKPNPNHKYVGGGDVGEGLPNSDFSCGGILDYETCEQVATVHGRWRPEIFAEKFCQLGWEYNTALLAYEANNHGHSSLNTARNVLRYPRLYYHTDYDAYANNRPKLGWQTNAKTRPILLDGLKDALHNRLIGVNDSEFLAECMVFEDDGTGKYASKQGYYDDRIFSWSIALQARKKKYSEPRVS